MCAPRSRAIRPAPSRSGSSRCGIWRDAHREELDALPSDDARWDRLCELNVAAQVLAVARSEVVQTAWERGAELAVHGWIYDLEDGLLRDLEVTVGASWPRAAA